MTEDATSPELKALADVLIGVLVRGLIAEHESATDKLSPIRCKEMKDRDDENLR